MSENSGRWMYKHLHPDSSGYADCFRILRDAVKDGIIKDWCYLSDFVQKGYAGIDVYPMEYRGHGWESFRDPDGTKGDIGLLREAADYVLELKRQKWLESQPKSVSEMTTEAIYQEILNSGYRIEIIFESGCWPSLCMTMKGICGHCTEQETTETLRDFYERCLEYARSNQP